MESLNIFDFQKTNIYDYYKKKPAWCRLLSGISFIRYKRWTNPDQSFLISQAVIFPVSPISRGWHFCWIFHKAPFNLYE